MLKICVFKFFMRESVEEHRVLKSICQKNRFSMWLDPRRVSEVFENHSKIAALIGEGTKRWKTNC